MRYILIILVITLFSSESFAQQNDGSWKENLTPLTGEWTLDATMGDRQLHQECTGNWVLNQEFLRFHCLATDPDTSGYESIYFITYNHEENHYVFHLFDVFGGAYSETLGFGKADDYSITFDFNYPDGLFRNEFVYNPEENTWRMILQSQNEEGNWESFAEKHLKKTSGE